MKHFTLADMTRSIHAVAHGIDNTPPASLIPVIMQTLAGMERLRAFLGHPITISSGYRCAELNHALGGAYNSQHKKGEAVDFTCQGFGTPAEVASAIAPISGVVGIDQLILEPGWVHVSFTLEPRGEVLTRIDGTYRVGLVTT